ncbi:luciferin sulfotransferase-like [Schistocerca gregaria]|uniref:luciferin sulfotransferase-like n=1 Tax=Schistocerca gregaria TaxID=7010 RepID=UPI00211ECFD0|nr:luciferin sulfotransferase-like [Schistocerca gregaria]
MSLRAEKLRSPLAVKFVSSVRGPLREDHVRVRPPGCVLPARYMRDARRILDLEVRPDDVWIVTLPKCGTTWSQEMVWLLMNDCDLEKAKQTPLTERFPFLEITSVTPNLSVKVPHSIDQVQSMKSPRLIKSHLPLELLPRQIRTVKPRIMYMMRNLKDMIVSYYHHYQLWGECHLTLDEFAECFMEDIPMYLPYWEHVIPFWNMRQEPHVLFYSYEEMKEDLATVVRRMAAFLGKPIAEEMVAKLVDHLSFDSMRDNPAVNNSSAVEHIRKEHQLEPAASTGRSFMRRGVVGEGGQRLSEGVQRRLERWTEERLQGRGYTGPR